MIAVYGFQAEFEAAIRSGQKGCTLRAIGKRRPPRPGDTLRLYIGRGRTASLVDKIAGLDVRPSVLNGKGRLDRGYSRVLGDEIDHGHPDPIKLQITPVQRQGTDPRCRQDDHLRELQPSQFRAGAVVVDDLLDVLQQACRERLSSDMREDFITESILCGKHQWVAVFVHCHASVILFVGSALFY